MSKKSNYTIQLSSREYGTEEWDYFTHRAAQAGMRRLKRTCGMANDGVMRKLRLFKGDDLLQEILVPKPTVLDQENNNG